MTLILLTCILVVAHIVETVTGFGATIMALSLGAHLVEVEVLVVALVLVAWIQSVWIVARGFRHIRWDLFLRRILPFCALGFPLGVWCFRSLGGEVLKLVLGAFVVVVSSMEIYRLFRRGSEVKSLPPAVGMGLLGGGGFFHGLFASGGPMVVYYASREIQEKSSFRATLSVLWLSLNTVLIITYAVFGRLMGEPTKLALYFLPALAFGILVGEILHARVNELAFRKLVQIALFLTGLSLLV